MGGKARIGVINRVSDLCNGLVHNVAPPLVQQLFTLSRISQATSFEASNQFCSIWPVWSYLSLAFRRRGF